MSSRRVSSQRRMMRLIVGVAVCIIVAVTGYCRSTAKEAAAPAAGADGLVDREALLYVTVPDSIPCKLLNYTGMNIGFNPCLHVPDWVAWELTADETEGAEPRSNKFAADESVEGSAEPWDYSYSGYDRGHMAPSADMKWSIDAQKESFLMTNMVPQSKSLNSGSWKRLEEKCRTWARVDGRLYIVCGPVIGDKAIEYIGDSKVYVPQRFFKVVLSLDGDAPRGIGFIMPNGKVPGGMQQAAVSIDEVERVTGYDFFSALPDDIEDAVESQKNFHKWSTIREKKQK